MNRKRGEGSLWEGSQGKRTEVNIETMRQWDRIGASPNIWMYGVSLTRCRIAHLLVHRMWRGYHLARGRYIRVVGRYRENAKRYGVHRCRCWVSPSASTHPVSTPEEGDDEQYDYENISAIQHDKGYVIPSAITIPVDTLAERVFPWLTFIRTLKGSAKDGTIVKVKRKQAMSLFHMIIEYNRV